MPRSAEDTLGGGAESILTPFSVPERRDGGEFPLSRRERGSGGEDVGGRVGRWWFR